MSIETIVDRDSSFEDEEQKQKQEQEQEQEPLEGMDEGELPVDPSQEVVIEKNDRSLAEFHRWFKAGRLILDPDWQRGFLWDLKRASRLIESFLVDIPVPVVYLAKNEEGKYEVIDGLQRLSSVFKFFDNQFTLRGLEMLRDHNGLHFSDLPGHLQNKLQDATLRTFELSPKTPKELMFVIFERLNTGGIALNDMEIRNCLYRGELNDLIRDLAHCPDFLASVNQQGLATRMSDRTLVLRFLAFYERTHLKAKNGLKLFLNEFYEYFRNARPEKIAEYEKCFKKCMRASVTVFGDKGFRLRRDGGEWATRVNAAVFQAVSTSFAQYDLSQITRRADAILEEYVDMASTDDKWVDCVRRATGEATRLSYSFEAWQERLQLAIADEQPNDAQRCFSRSLKEEMFRQDSNCAVCGQRIILLLDAALDHELHYWRGGRTVPENARLVHRRCNLIRPK